MIRAINLKISYATLIFEKVTFTIGNKEKVGLVGFNGSGKTTLMRILSGIEKPDSGDLLVQNETVAYLPQIYKLEAYGQKEEDLMLGEYLESLVTLPSQDMWKIQKILSSLDFKNYDEFQRVSTLSPGEKMKIYLVKLLINEPTVLLMDEPTNHLDINGIIWLESFIKTYNGSIITISHDREFLNSICNKIFEIDEKTLKIYEGNYNNYKEQKIKVLIERYKQINLQEKRRKKFEDMIVRIKKMKEGDKQARALQSARTRFEREVKKNEIFEYKDLKIKDLDIKGDVHNQKIILNIKNLSFGYEKNNYIIESSNLVIRGTEKVCLVGSNGIGKSTLFKLIIGELNPKIGTINFGLNLKYAYFSQDQSHLPLEITVREYLLQNTDISYTQSFGILDKYLFTKDIQDRLIKSLSPGQKARLSFMIFSLHEYQFLILDEPTNHLDIETKESIENALKSFKGSILLISHDRYFIESLDVDRYITINNKSIIEV